ncbi:thiol reductant ABC exporter subunit CydD [Evansella tamaricis]|uniref:Thiol reductant ABC exporter subunit CydD n=1 Tax=Evansella tamaricis TaxID=2069301 RepID=A0ABS6JLP6_9BACI|nr:thiol reductant ABC exporter subunit CydD [Evansella tamaricis]MBU9714599.1 thiol reductant ABC exporter subunit CydD [Evansella tamaricis]
MKQLKEMARSQKKRMYSLLFLSVLTGVVIIAQAYFIVSIVDTVFLNRGSFQEIVPQLLGLIIVLSSRALFAFLNGKIGIKMAEKAKGDLRMSLVEKYRRNPIQASIQGQSGEKVSVMMDSIDEIDSYFSKYFPQMIQTSIVPIMILVAVFYYNWVSGLIMLVTAPFIPIFMILIGGATQKKSEEQMEKLAVFSGRFLDVLQGLTTLKLFGKAKEKQDVIRDSSIDYRDATMDVLKIAFLSSLALEFISMLSIGLIALEVGLRLVIYGHLSFFIAFFVLILAPEFYNSLKELGSAFHSGRGSMGAARRVYQELEEEEQGIQWGNHRLNMVSSPPAITLANVNFAYGEGQFSLNHITGEIPSFSQVAIVGRSGSGKSTLLNLLSGIIAPSAGSVYVNGLPLSEYKEEDWFNHLSYISQNPYLFSGTIFDNIAIGVHGNVLREEVIKAAEKAGIGDMIQSLETGYNTIIGEGGRGLSGGEKQRIALARAFLKKPTIVLFDEPTVGLDLKTERILKTSMEELSETSTVITVAHRLHTIKNADQIFFLNEGNLLAKGTHGELLAEVPEYRRMVSLQQGGDAG